MEPDVRSAESANAWCLNALYSPQVQAALPQRRDIALDLILHIRHPGAPPGASLSCPLLHTRGKLPFSSKTTLLIKHKSTESTCIAPFPITFDMRTAPLLLLPILAKGFVELKR